MSNDNSGDDDSEITVKRERTVLQRESLKVESQRGTGTNDRDKVKKFVEREAELDVPDGMLDRMPSLVGEQEQARAVSDVIGTMREVREAQLIEEE